MPHAAIQARSTVNCMPPSGTNVHQSGTEIANSIRLAASATYLANRPGRRMTTRPAISGHASSTVSTQGAYISSLPARGAAARRRRTPPHTSHLPRLQPAVRPAERARAARGAIDRGAVNDALVDLLPQHLPRQPDDRPDNQRVVDLVDVPLVAQHTRKAALLGRAARGHEVLRPEQPPGADHADDGGRDGDN